MTVPNHLTLKRWLGYALEIQRGTQPGDAKLCAEHLEHEIRAILEFMGYPTAAPPAQQAGE